MFLGTFSKIETLIFFFFCKQDLLLLAIKYRRVGWGGEEVQEEGDICIPMADSL